VPKFLSSRTANVAACSTMKASSVFKASSGWSGEIELVLAVMSTFHTTNNAKGNLNAKLRPGASY
jgi:hypothetical protein